MRKVFRCKIHFWPQSSSRNTHTHTHTRYSTITNGNITLSSWLRCVAVYSDTLSLSRSVGQLAITLVKCFATVPIAVSEMNMWDERRKTAKLNRTWTHTANNKNDWMSWSISIIRFERFGEIQYSSFESQSQYFTFSYIFFSGGAFSVINTRGKTKNVWTLDVRRRFRAKRSWTKW